MAGADVVAGVFERCVELAEGSEGGAIRTGCVGGGGVGSCAGAD